MVKLWMVIVSVLVFAGMASAANILANADLETGGGSVPDSWGEETASGITMTWLGSGGVGDSRAWEIEKTGTLPSTSRPGLKQLSATAVSTGESMIFSAYLKVNQASSSSNFRPGFELRFYDQSMAQVSLIAYEVPTASWSSTWTEVTGINTTVPNGATSVRAYLYTRFWTSANNGDVVSWDNANLVPEPCTLGLLLGGAALSLFRRKYR